MVPRAAKYLEQEAAMSVEFIFRIIGMIVFGVLGTYLGIIIGNASGESPELAGFLFCLVGILFG